MSSKRINLASARLGAKAVFSTDDFFADMSRLIDDAEPVFIDGKFDDHGKWMDGWESRRKRAPGYDFCVVKLAARTRIQDIEIDTRHFTGNFPPAASVQGCDSAEDIPADDVQWTELTGVRELNGDDQLLVACEQQQAFTHVRLNIYPDGGVARLRVYGQPDIDWRDMDASQPLDLAASLNGGIALDCNDEHYGTINNLLAPGRGVNMGDGWETRRRRKPGHDWVIVRLGHAGRLCNVEVDTAHFKGNFPEQCSLQGIYLPDAAENSLAAQSLYWQQLMPGQKLQADHIHSFELASDQPMVNYVRFNIFPDGGVSRLRLFGNIESGSPRR